MSKLGSEFIDDFEKDDTGLSGINKKRISLIFGIVTQVALTVGISYLELPDIIYEIYFIIVTFPAVFYGINASEMLQLKGRIHFFFLERKRVYRTELEELEENEKRMRRKEMRKVNVFQDKTRL